MRQFKSLEIKNATLIRYSRGGQYFIAVEKQWVHVFNAYTLQPLQKFKHTGVKATDIIFEENDKAFALISSCGYLGKWKIPGFQ